MDANAVWRWSLAVACLSGAAWLKWCSGVSHDSKIGNETTGNADGFRGGLSDAALRSGICDRGADRGADMKGPNAADTGQVIDLQDYRNRRAVREWAIACGWGVRAPEVKK